MGKIAEIQQSPQRVGPGPLAGWGSAHGRAPAPAPPPRGGRAPGPHPGHLPAAKALLQALLLPATGGAAPPAPPAPRANRASSGRPRCPGPGALRSARSGAARVMRKAHRRSDPPVAGDSVRRIAFTPIGGQRSFEEKSEAISVKLPQDL